MAKNRVLNVTANGNWQTLGDAEHFPNQTFSIMLQARTAADCYYKFAGVDEFVTVKSGTVVTITGKFDPGEFQVRAANGVVLELDLSTVVSA